MENSIRFGFGKNWKSFVNTALDDQRIVKATDSLRRLLGVQHLHGRTFLDIGCGSGLFSLGACLLGAERVVGFDFDQDSVEASLQVRTRSGISSERWQIFKGSILDSAFIDQLEPADIVYSWGVLHHTGDMWSAINNSVTKVKPGGSLALALYNNVERGFGGSGMWWHIKRSYNTAPPVVKRLAETGYVGASVLLNIASLRNPIPPILNYSTESGRGMDFMHDVRDWLGGFPYEYATAGEVFEYVHNKFGFELQYLNTHDGHGCNEFTFHRPNP